MRISMAMLADRLHGYDPEPHIVNGGRVLRSARLLSDSQVRSQSILYLQQNSSDTVACVHGNDMLFLHSNDLDGALNDILDEFDAFDDWHEEAGELIAGGCSLHELTESIAHAMNVSLIVADATYFIHDWAAGPVGFNDPVFERFNSERSMPLDMIMRIDADPKVRKKGVGVYFEPIDENRNSIVCNIFVGGEHKGWVVAVRENGVYTLGDQDFLEAATGLVEWWMRQNQSKDDRWEQTAILRNLAEGGSPDSALVGRALSVFGWSDSDALRVYAVRQDALSKRPMFVVERFLSQIISHSLVFGVDDGLVVVANESLADERAYREEVVQLLRTCGFHAGRSPRFFDVMELSTQLDSALVAADSADAGNPLVSFEDVKLAYSLSVLRTRAVADVRHGALDELAAYDSEHGTQLYGTLKCFVVNRGGYARTYNQLYIHRSTLQYRLDRIAEICEIDFDDPSVWAHLQLSFLLDE